jgi:hypothetical protein
MARIYATTTDTDQATEDQLARASLAVDRALIGALYNTDTDGMPTDTDTITALKEATIAQARAIAANDLGPNLKSASIGSSSYSYDTATPNGLSLQYGGGLCPDAAAILQLAGLTPAGVTIHG